MDKKKISVKEILADLENGLTRKEIKEKYKLTLNELKFIFQHPKLKNKKARKQVGIELVDDTEEVESKSSKEVDTTDIEKADTEETGMEFNNAEPEDSPSDENDSVKIEETKTNFNVI